MNLKRRQLRKLTKEQLRQYLLERCKPNAQGCWIWQKGVRGYAPHRYGVAFNLGANRLAAVAFKGYDVRRRTEICHTCDNSLCINPQHLFEGTHCDNMRDMVVKGRSRAPQGDESPNAKVERTDAVQMRRLFKSGKVTTKELSARYGVSISSVQRILTGKRWKCIDKRISPLSFIDRKGERNCFAKLKVRQVLQIVRSYQPRHVSQDKLALQYSVSRGTIGDILRGKTWKHITGRGGL